MIIYMNTLPAVLLIYAPHMVATIISLIAPRRRVYDDIRAYLDLPSLVIISNIHFHRKLFRFGNITRTRIKSMTEPTQS